MKHDKALPEYLRLPVLWIYISLGLLRRAGSRVDFWLWRGQSRLMLLTLTQKDIDETNEYWNNISFDFRTKLAQRIQEDKEAP